MPHAVAATEGAGLQYQFIKKRKNFKHEIVKSNVRGQTKQADSETDDGQRDLAKKFKIINFKRY